jgi:hypothetical protein
MQQQQLAGSAVAAAAEVQLSCPLPSDPFSSSSNAAAAAAAADEVRANCGALSEPLPVLPVIYRSSSAPSTPPEAAANAAAEVTAAPARTTSCPDSLAASSSIGCLGRWAVLPPGVPSVQHSGRRKQQRKLAEVASGWLKQLAARKASKARV